MDFKRDYAALDELQLLPRVIHEQSEVNPRWQGLGIELPGPLFVESPTDWPARITSRRENALGSVWLLPPLRMGQLVPLVREAASLGVLAVGVDFALLVSERDSRPRSREELSELKNASAVPFVVAGLLDPHDAEAAVEAGADVIIACSKLSNWLGGPPLAQLVPDVLDAIGETTLLVRGGLRNGADVLRYLALGADALVLPPALNPHHLLEEFAQVLRITGCAALADIGYDLIFEPTFE
jgi:isopentenyl diphosphate isomerase/L-lactate dehydrogenase-like FMN-dependent dehydrogenase